MVTDNFRPQTKRQMLELMRSELDNERQSWINHWRDLSDYVLPRRGRFQITDQNRGERRSQKIIDTTASLAARTLRSGMMSGITSPARPWFRLTVPDANLSEIMEVKDWLHEVTTRMNAAFLRCNLYNTLPVVYGDLGNFGTSPMLVEEEFTGKVIRTTVFPIGSYMIGADEYGTVNVFVREYRMTVRQIVNRFGYEESGIPGVGEPDWTKFSETVKRLWLNGQREQWIDVIHVIYPNDKFNPRRMESKYKKFSSDYYERGCSGQASPYLSAGVDDDRYLRESGHDLFPVLCPRWEVAAGDTYASNCPGMTALGDIRQLQLGEKRVMQAVEKTINPPMVGPHALRATRVSILPGDVTFLDEPDGSKGFRPAHETRFPINDMEMKQGQVRHRISRAYYEDLFLMLAESDRREITAREVDERHEEKLQALGPVLEGMNQDLLDPLIDITFYFMNRQGLIPPPPEEIQGMDLRVEYVSVMAQAQKLVGIAGIERFAGFVQGVAAIDPQILDKVDRDQLVDEYGERTGIPPRIIVPDEEVAAIRAQRQQQQEQMVQAEQLKAGAKAAKDLSGAEMEKDSALTRLLQTAQAGA